MNVQEFSIKDLESFSGIKAHTIRIWEQRYNILNPDRTDTNIRKYTDKDLKQLLNIALLNSLGYKISRIAGMNEENISSIIQKHALTDSSEEHYLQLLKMAMINFDEALFVKMTNRFIRENGMEKTFIKLFIPFLRQVGFLWLTNAICPAQEHFVTSIIRGILYSSLNELEPPATDQGRQFILYLPELEIHELSLLMLHYLLRKNKFRSIYLGQSVPMEDLKSIYLRIGNAEFISILTTQPPTVLVNDYLKKISEIFRDTNCRFHFSGLVVQEMESLENDVISLYKDVDSMYNSIISSILV